LVDPAVDGHVAGTERRAAVGVRTTHDDSVRREAGRRTDRGAQATGPLIEAQPLRAQDEHRRGSVIDGHRDAAQSVVAPRAAPAVVAPGAAVDAARGEPAARAARRWWHVGGRPTAEINTITRLGTRRGTRLGVWRRAPRVGRRGVGAHSDSV